MRRAFFDPRSSILDPRFRLVGGPLRLVLLLAASLASLRPAAAEDALPIETLTALKAATVFLKVEVGGESGSGSGFVIRTEGQTAFVVTNNHVIDPPIGTRPGQPRPPAARPIITAVLGSGTPRERSARAEVLAADPRRDLAILRVADLRDLPAPIDFTHEPKVVETMPVYIFGFPLGELLATGKANPAITVGKGSVSSIRLNDRGDVATIQIDGDVTPGNSGGPVLDAQGRLVGIANATIRTRRIGFAIPAASLRKLVQGQLLDYQFSTRLAGQGTVEVTVELGVFDPFERIKGISFYYLRQNAVEGKKLAALPGVQQVALQRGRQQVIGKFVLDGAAGEVPIVFQAVWVNGEGKTFLTNPRRYALKPPRR